ncbi:MAG: NIPSNAP family protein [SAR202 cluster bacterium]|nr:NIPSNAP family protein [SAR202 cluster bacterium]
MLYEMRFYEAMPGKMGALHDRFANHTNKLFAKHGFRVVGYWNEVFGDSSRLNYMLAWETMDERMNKWAAFQVDPEWQAARDASEKNGPIVARIDARVWRPTHYSPMR